MNVLQRMALLSVLATAAVAVAFGAYSVAQGDTGDNLRQFDAQVPGCGVGTGIAFDGTHLYLSCWGSNVLERVSPADGASDGPITIAGLSDIRAMAWDGSRSAIWACEGNSGVALIDPDGQTGEVKFSVAGCTDGLAYDGSDDTIWASPDAYGTIYHYGTTGDPLGSFEVTSKLGGECGNSGIAVGGEKLYLANNGCSEIYECSKDLETCTLMSSFPRRLEDLECDNLTFAPKAAIWSQDAYDRTLNAWEIPAGQCFFGGGSGESPPPQDEEKPTATPCIPPLVNYRCDGSSSSGGGGSAATPTAAPTTAPGTNPPPPPAPPTAPGGGQAGVIVAPDTGDGGPGSGSGNDGMALITLGLAGIALAGVGALRLRGSRTP